MGVSGNPKGSSKKARERADPNYRGYVQAKREGRQPTVEERAANAARVARQRSKKA